MRRGNTHNESNNRTFGLGNNSSNPSSSNVRNSASEPNTFQPVFSKNQYNGSISSNVGQMLQRNHQGIIFKNIIFHFMKSVSHLIFFL